MSPDEDETQTDEALTEDLDLVLQQILNKAECDQPHDPGE
jgi:hypothetical protein